ncbi:prolyl oligopeptidase family serine peptidase [Zunongwangia mangrovi]|uniref:prolyl oligopeptidase family serine peptidase n=1 Tax=Zunongwangia mangrovi TaxID=1334022 RepID=UPI002936EF2B|nr:prolyl oligopeptidase family serine peptidase [Zunongwangia mangrovi]
MIPFGGANKTSELKKRSVYYWPEELDKNASLLILCGTRDQQVNPNQAKKIAQKLSNIDYDFQLKEFDTDHSFSDKKQELQKLMTKWFDDRL